MLPCLWVEPSAWTWYSLFPCFACYHSKSLLLFALAYIRLCLLLVLLSPAGNLCRAHHTHKMCTLPFLQLDDRLNILNHLNSYLVTHCLCCYLHRLAIQSTQTHIPVNFTHSTIKHFSLSLIVSFKVLHIAMTINHTKQHNTPCMVFLGPLNGVNNPSTHHAGRHFVKQIWSKQN